MSTLLLFTLIVLKAICLFGCWRAVSMAKKQKMNSNINSHSNTEEAGKNKYTSFKIESSN
jgi:uncharacterized membrane protein